VDRTSHASLIVVVVVVLLVVFLVLIVMPLPSHGDAMKKQVNVDNFVSRHQVLVDAVQVIEIPSNYDLVVVVDFLQYTVVVHAVEVVEIVMPSEFGVVDEQIVTTIEPLFYCLLLWPSPAHMTYLMNALPLHQYLVVLAHVHRNQNQRYQNKLYQNQIC
jgi:hypothetical protein